MSSFDPTSGTFPILPTRKPWGFARFLRSLLARKTDADRLIWYCRRCSGGDPERGVLTTKGRCQRCGGDLMRVSTAQSLL
jgi:hypothetical protein